MTEQEPGLEAGKRSAGMPFPSISPLSLPTPFLFPLLTSLPAPSS